MKFIKYIIKENTSIKASIDLNVNINYIRQKIISELGLTYHIKSNSTELQTLYISYFILKKVNLHISFNNNEKHKSIRPSEFIILKLNYCSLIIILI